MPLERKRYPVNWEAISLEVREQAGWKCQECGIPCRRPGEDWLDFALELIHDGWLIDLDKPTVHTLTTAHLDQNPSNNDPSNLKALCAPCHLRHDAKFLKANRMAKLERCGQLNLLDTLEVGHGA